MFPLNILLDTSEQQTWQNDYYGFYKYDIAIIQQSTKLFSEVISPVQRYWENYMVLLMKRVL